MKYLKNIIGFIIVIAIILLLMSVPDPEYKKQEPPIDYESTMTTLDFVILNLDKQIDEVSLQFEAEKIRQLYYINYYMEMQGYGK